MSLRTRRSLAFMASLVILVLACSGTAAPTAAPTGGTPTTAPTAGPTTPPGEPTATPGEPTTAPTDVAPSGDAEEQVFRIYCCATDPRSLQPQAASGSDEISIEPRCACRSSREMNNPSPRPC